MHIFDYKDTPRKLLTPEVVGMLASLHEERARQGIYSEAKADKDVLSSLVDLAKIQSTKASNKIEGIFTSDKRLEAIVMEKSAPKNRAEEEISGYRDVLATIHENYEFIPPSPGVLLQLHRDLYAFSSVGAGGHFKNSDNIIAETDKEGVSKARFIPTPAFQTPEAVQTLCTEFINALNAEIYDPLALIPMFILDFLCIHPFNDGNGRMSRLLTLLLLYRSGYMVGKYISIEALIEKSKEVYYNALQESSVGWHDSKNDYLPFISYYLGIILKAYREFEDRAGYIRNNHINKGERVKAVFDRNIGKITKSDISKFCPDISQTTIERSLAALLKEGYIEKGGKSKGTYYVKTDRNVN